MLVLFFFLLQAAPSLLSLSGWFVCEPRSRKTEGKLSPGLCCIVVEATQVLQSSLVTELVLILGETQTQREGQRCLRAEH